MAARLMRPMAFTSGCLAVLIASLCAALSGSARAAGPEIGTDAQRESGRKLYAKNCSQCHGEKGDGEGYATPHLYPRPRNFTTGKFKIRTTPNGALPTHQDLVNIIKRGMPYTSMPAWPNLSDEELSDLAYFITTFSPEFSGAGNAAQPVSLPSAPTATKESVELGKKLFEENGCVKCHGTLGRGDGPSAPTLTDDWGYPIRAADLTQSWTFRGGSSREDIFRAMSTGLNGTPMPSFADALNVEQRWAITDFIDSLSGSDGPGYTNLVVAKHVDDPIDLDQGDRQLRIRACRTLSNHRTDHRARTRVPSSCDVRDRSGDLRCRVDRAARPMARHERAEDGEERTVASRATGGGGGQAVGAAAAGGASAGGSDGSVFGDAEVAPTPAGQSQTPGGAQQPAADPFAEAETGAGRPAIRVLRRSLDPDSVAGADRRPQALLHFRRRPEPGGSLVLRSGPPRSPPVHRPGKRGDRSERHGRSSPVWRGTTGRMVRHFQAAASGQLGRPVLRLESSCPSPSRSGTGSRASVATGEVSPCGTAIYLGPEAVPSVVGPMIRTALFILAIELAVIGWVRWRYSLLGPATRAAVSARQQPATSV